MPAESSHPSSPAHRDVVAAMMKLANASCLSLVSRTPPLYYSHWKLSLELAPALYDDETAAPSFGIVMIKWVIIISLVNPRCLRFRVRFRRGCLPLV